MKFDLNKNLFKRGYHGHEKVFLLFPRYIDGCIVWLEYVWKHYCWEFDVNLLFPRVVKKYYKYSRFE